MKFSLHIMPFLFLFLTGIYSLKAHQNDSLNSGGITFIENKKQWHDNVLFKVHLNSGAFFLEKNRITFAILNEKQLNEFHEAKTQATPLKKHYVDAAAYQVQFKNANESPQISGNDKRSQYHNYFIGNDQSRWASNVGLFHSVTYHDLYDGIDLHFYESNGLCKYDFIIREHISPNIIQLEYLGVNSLNIINQNLVINTNAGKVTELRPRAYQISPSGDTIDIPCKYQLKKHTLQFELGQYDHALPLIIDPTLIFSSYSGSLADNWGYTATFDSDGNLYGGGIARSIGYPVTPGAYQVNYAGGGYDIAISKFNANGNALLYSTYLGGSYVEIPNSMIVNENDELYLLGTTGSPNFPVTSGSFSNSFMGGDTITLTGIHFVNGSDMVVCKLSSDGRQLLSSTFLGGSENDGLNAARLLKKNYADEVRGEIIIDHHSNVYIASSTLSPDFPVTPGCFQETSGGNQDGCIVKLNHNLSNLIWASYIGGEGDDAVYSIVHSRDNSIYVCGGTSSANFPVSQNAYQTQFGGGNSGSDPDGFISHIDEFGTMILHSTYLGSSSYDQTYLIKNDKHDNPHVFGQTSATGNFWIKNATWFTNGGGQFLSKLTPSLDDIQWSTAFGTGKRGPDISPSALLVDLCNNIYMSGWGSIVLNKFGGTAGLPVTADAFQPTTDNNDYYFICIKDDVSALVYATFFGSPYSNEHVDGGTSRFDNKGKIYQAVCGGCGGDNNFPTTPGAWSQTNGSQNCNLAVIKMDFNLPSVVADFRIPNTICAPHLLVLDNRSQVISTNTNFLWDFGDGTTSTQENPTHLYTQAGLYQITLIVEDAGSCNFSDTLKKNILVMANSVYTLPTVEICENHPIQIGFPPGADPNLTYQWSPSAGLSNANISNPIANPASNTTYMLIVSDNVCRDTIFQDVKVFSSEVILNDNIEMCKGDSILLSPQSYDPSFVRFYWSLNPSFQPIINSDISNPSIRVSPGSTTTYYLMAESSHCQEIRSVKVTISNVSISAPSSITLCFDEDESVTIQTNCTNCTYYWSPQDIIVSGIGTASVTVNSPYDTTLRVIAENNIGCRDTAFIQVIKQKNSFPLDLVAWASKQDFFIGDTLTLYATKYNNGYSYRWEPATGLSSPHSPSSIARPSATTIYTVYVTDSYGCVKSDTVKVRMGKLICDEPYIFVPNAFTPDGNQTNDLLYVRGEYIQRLLFRIYDRWGKLLFETNNQEKGWDGTFKGKDCPSGVYDYYLETICTDGAKFIKKGNITLIR